MNLVNDQELKNRIKNAAQANVPDVRARVLAQAPMPTPRRLPSFRLAFGGAFALIALIMFFVWPTATGVYATVHLDINPSIAIDLDESERVMDVRALNNDAQDLLDAIDLNGINAFDNLVDILIDEAIAQGMMTDDNPFIMVDITGRDEAFIHELYGRLSERIPAHAMARIPNVEVIRGSAEDARPDEVDRAHQHNMSVQRLRLIEAIIEKTDYDFETLRDMRVADLMHLAREHGIEPRGNRPDMTPGPPNRP